MDAVDQFQGVSLSTPRGVLGQGLFQADVGGDRFKRGSWRRRRGSRHTDVAKKDNAITAILGFEFAGAGFAVVLVEGVKAHGHTDAAEQSWVIPAAGIGEYGESYGDEPYGE